MKNIKKLVVVFLIIINIGVIYFCFNRSEELNVYSSPNLKVAIRGDGSLIYDDYFYLQEMSFDYLDDFSINKDGRFKINLDYAGLSLATEYCYDIAVELIGDLSFEPRSLDDLFQKRVCTRVVSKDDTSYGKIESIGGFSRSIYPYLFKEVPYASGEVIVKINGDVIYSERILITDNPDVELSNRASATYAKTGDVITYTYAVKNVGDFVLRNSILSNTLDSNLEIVDSTLDYKINNGTYNFYLPDIPKGELYEFSIKAKVRKAEENTILDNKITVKSEFIQTETASSKVTLKKESLDLITSTNKEKLKPGEEFLYNISVKNTGLVNANNVKIDALLSEFVEVIDKNGASNSNNTLSWNIDNLNVNETKDFTVKLKVKDNAKVGSIINNTAKVIINEEEYAKKINEASIEEAKLTINITSDKKSVSAGEDIVYTITIENKNNVSVKNVVLREKLDDNLIIEEALLGVIEGNTITYNIDEIKAMETKTFTIKARVKSDVISDDDINIDNETNAKEDGLENDNISKDDVIIDKEESVIPPKEEDPNDIENPQTGTKAFIVIAILGVILVFFIIKNVKNKNNLYKI